MILSDVHLETIRELALGVKYGSVTIHYAENSGTIEINVQNRIRLEREPETEKKTCKSEA
jgi:hypothetical protein